MSPAVAKSSKQRAPTDSEPTNPFLSNLQTDILNIQSALSGTRPRVNSAEARYALDELDALTRSIAIAASERYAESMTEARRSSKGDVEPEGAKEKTGVVSEQGTERAEKIGAEAEVVMMGGGGENTGGEKNGGNKGVGVGGTVPNTVADFEGKGASPKASVSYLSSYSL